MESQNAGLVQGNEGDGQVKFGSGLSPNTAPDLEPSQLGNDQIQGPPEAAGARAEVPAGEPEQQAFIGSDGQVHQIPPELIGPDGKMLPLTEKTMRMLRGKHFTVRHDAMPCGHKIDRVNQPKTNCEICWWNWLNTHGELVRVADDFFRQYGKERLVAMRGRVFVRMFLRFMSTVQHIMEEQKAQESKSSSENNLLETL